MITDFDDAYANGAHIAGAADYPPRWAAKAEAFRAGRLSEHRAEIDIPYGESPRQMFDLFLPADHAKGLAVFVHGGYWKAFGKSDWSHLAAGALDNGWAVALPGYTLAPQARITEIGREIAAAITALAERIEGPIRLSGHSAGGHLVTRMICEGTSLAPHIPSRIEHVLSISGVHDLRPIRRTAMNEILHIDDAEAMAESPALLAPVVSCPVTCFVGANERPEFVRQTHLLASIWTGLGAEIRSIEAPHKHHFDVIDGLEDTNHPLCRLFAP